MDKPRSRLRNQSSIIILIALSSQYCSRHGSIILNTNASTMGLSILILTAGRRPARARSDPVRDRDNVPAITQASSSAQQTSQ
jgi:hypothetical protein